MYFLVMAHIMFVTNKSAELRTTIHEFRHFERDIFQRYNYR
jgi:hypothetical protein